MNENYWREKKSIPKNKSQRRLATSPGQSIDSFRMSESLHIPYLNHDVFVRRESGNAVGPDNSATLSPSSLAASALKRPAAAASAAKKPAAAATSTAHPGELDASLASSSSSSSPSSSSSSGLEKICEANGFEFSHWYRSGSSGGASLPLDEIEALVEEAWAHDYRKSNQARLHLTPTAPHSTRRFAPPRC